MKKPLIFLIVFFAVLAAYFAFESYYSSEELPEEFIASFEECVEAGHPVMESYPRQCRTPDGQTFVEDIGNELEKADLIRIDNPRPSQVIESPLSVKGEARGYWFFEADFPVKLYDNNGFLLGMRPAHALGEWMTERFVPFEVILPFSVPSAPKGTLILEKDNPSGLPENSDQLRVPVNFKEAGEEPEELMAVEIYLNDSRYANEPYFDCSRTAAVEREVAGTEAVARASLGALLRGGTDEERKQGYISNVNPGTRIRGITIEKGTARVDFDEQLEYQMGGSCRVAAVRAQITDTLMQFPTVDEVIISVNGRTEDILQP